MKIRPKHTLCIICVCVSGLAIGHDRLIAHIFHAVGKAWNPTYLLFTLCLPYVLPFAHIIQPFHSTIINSHTLEPIIGCNYTNQSNTTPMRTLLHYLIAKWSESSNPLDQSDHQRAGASDRSPPLQWRLFQP